MAAILCEWCTQNRQRAISVSGQTITEGYCTAAIFAFPKAVQCREYVPVSAPEAPPKPADPAPAAPRRADGKPAQEKPRGGEPKFHFVEDYRKLVGDLLSRHPIDEAMSIAVGGHFKALGDIEKQLLLQQGLKPEHTIVDVGCGSGRLATALANYLTPPGHYVGTDVVSELLDYAKGRTPSTWQYSLTTDLTIPCADASADFVCFFSVFTHLLQTESYCYLLEARRVLKPGGKIVFSFLELPDNWAIFEQSYEGARRGGNVHLNEFFGRDAIRVWAEHLEVTVLHIWGAHEPFIEMPPEPGSGLERKMPLGQAVCTMQRPLVTDMRA